MNSMIPMDPFQLSIFYGSDSSPAHTSMCQSMCMCPHTLAIYYVNIYALPTTVHFYNHDNLLHLLGLGQECKIPYQNLHLCFWG